MHYENIDIMDIYLLKFSPKDIYSIICIMENASQLVQY